MSVPVNHTPACVTYHSAGPICLYLINMQSSESSGGFFFTLDSNKLNPGRVAVIYDLAIPRVTIGFSHGNNNHDLILSFH